MKSIHVYLLMLSIPLMALQCNKESNSRSVDTSCKLSYEECELAKLPPITATGEHTFGCLVNGQAWLPEKINPLPAISFDYWQHAFSLRPQQPKASGGLGEYMYIGGKDLNDSINSTEYISISYINYNSNCFYDGRFLNAEGWLKFHRFDTLNEIFSGTFNFTLYLDSSGCDTVHLTYGRFDVKD